MTTQNPTEWLFLAANLCCLAAGMIPGLLKAPRKTEMPLKTESKIVISTKESFYHARVKPRFSFLVAILAFFFVGLILWQDNRLLALITLATTSFAIGMPLLDMKIKEVSVVDEGLLVSDFSRSEIIPFPNVKEVKVGNSRATIPYVFVLFTAKGPFGEKMYFRPVDRLEIKRLLEPLGVKFIDSSW